MVAGTDDKAHQHPVKVGIRDGDKVQIIEGLQAGDKIVGTGAYGLPDNSRISAAEAKPEENQPAGSSQKE
jgi:HlyD family secretion protein